MLAFDAADYATECHVYRSGVEGRCNNGEGGLEDIDDDAVGLIVSCFSGCIAYNFAWGKKLASVFCI